MTLLHKPVPHFDTEIAFVDASCTARSFQTEAAEEAPRNGIDLLAKTKTAIHFWDWFWSAGVHRRIEESDFNLRRPSAAGRSGALGKP